MTIQIKDAQLRQLIETETEISRIMAKFPVITTNARHEFSEMLGQLHDISPVALKKELYPMQGRIDEIFHLSGQLHYDYNEFLQKLKAEIKRIKSEKQLLLAKNLNIKSKSFTNYPLSGDLDPNTDNELTLFLQGLLDYNVSFKFPGLILGGEVDQCLNTMVANDPLYTCVNNSKMEKYQTMLNNDFYFSKRLRKYNYDNFSLESLDALPKGQFGLIVATGHIDMLPRYNIQAYMTQIGQLLRLGGTFIFSFFDIDILKAAEAMELHLINENIKHQAAINSDPIWWHKLEPYPSCLTLHDYLPIINSTQMRFISYNQFAYHSIVVCKRLGDIQTIKLSQNLGEIKSTQD
jgi:hypothetical protein